VESLGVASDGVEILCVELEAANGMRMRVLNLGGIVQSLHVPDAAGTLADVVLGFDDPSDYLADQFYLGALVGRFSNRIAGASFVLDGETVHVSANRGRHHLHGGHRGFDKVRWEMTPFASAGTRGVALSYTSADGEEGFPGTLRTRVTYTLSDDGAWEVEYHAESDRATPVNLTQHSYFNLAGAGSALDHQLRIHASRYLPQTADQIPTGAIAPLAGTPFDLRTSRALRDVAAAPDLAAGGLDHTYVLEQPSGTLFEAAQVVDPASGRVLTVSTTAPSLHCYTARYLTDVRGKGGASYAPYDAVCLEAQHYPDAPNHPHFPSTIVRPGAPYHARTRFAFSAR
jgi:aldose 1-epimerase